MLTDDEVLQPLEEFKKSMTPEEWRALYIANLKMLSILRFHFMKEGDVLRGLVAIENLILQNPPKTAGRHPLKTTWAMPDEPPYSTTP